ncbi:putative Ser/Thr phosphatase family protein [Blattamonas nauphoetae]|uniref:Ser/Thr phosphatase family protein n=1 Tax=Blattamonas nauphoetae TaxID=2049346 RepID=A0ABQ9XLS3_9EUKA|nr:putative Ser/Thr phosphatase family protein [Blattamonas nauphoetae]
MPENRTKPSRRQLILLICIVPVLLCVMSYPLFRNLEWLFDPQVKLHPWLRGLFITIAFLTIISCGVLTYVSRLSLSNSIDYISRAFIAIYLFTLDLFVVTILMEIIYGLFKPLRSHKPVITIIELCLIVGWQIFGNVLGTYRRKRELIIKSSLVQDSFRIVHLSDIHLGSHGPNRLKKIVPEVNELNADMVCITGDLTDTKRIIMENQPLEGSERLLPSNGFYPLTELKAPSGVFFVTGNHDVMSGKEELYDILRKCPNLTILSNESQIVEIVSKQTKVKIIGIEDGDAKYFVDTAKMLEGASSKGSSSRTGFQTNGTTDESSLYTILLHHRPHKKVWRDVMRSLHVDMFLAGHTHAGQMFTFRPLIWLVHNPDVWLSTLDETNKKQNSSILSYDKPFMYVSPGTGTAGSSKRTSFLCEITVFNVSPSS